jgi:3-dehydroquinate synthase
MSAASGVSGTGVFGTGGAVGRAPGGRHADAGPNGARVAVDLGARSYDIVVGEGLVARTGALLAPLLPQRRVGIVTDTNVAPPYLAPLLASLEAAGIAHEAVIVPAGEQAKDFTTLKMVCEAMLDAGLERSSALLALGGGVVGDLAGFAAGILLRGVPYVQVPTTLLAQVDSSVGGKTGVNTRQGKNLIGLFHQPLAVIADVTTLETLDPRQLRAGYAEVVKYGLIEDVSFFAWLERHGAALLAGDRALRRQAVAASCRAKAAVVAADEREAGVRALLNLGHTFGHALEAETGFGDALLHGEAVALGCVLAFELSARLGLCPRRDAHCVRRHFAAVGLATELAGLMPASTTPASLLAHMRHDKKVEDGRLAFVLSRGIGDAFVSRDVPPAEVERLLDDALARPAAPATPAPPLR